MKKIVLILMMFLLTSCTSRSDYFTFGFDDYRLTPGYDKGSYLDIAFDFERQETLTLNQTYESEFNLLGNYAFKAELTNLNKKDISYEDATLTKLTIYLKDLGNRQFSINEEPLDSSIKNSCDKYNGQYVERNGKACLIESEVKDKNNYIIMYGDILGIDQDQLDHIEIGIK